MLAASTLSGAAWVVWGLLLVLSPVWAANSNCPPTKADSLGPFYVPNAPERESTGQGLVLSGVVRASSDCRPLDHALIEWWAANVHGEYDEAHRAVQRHAADGRYQYQTDFPGHYPGRPPHVHVRVTAPGHRTLVTQVYPKEGQTTLSIDFVLLPR